MTTEPPLEALFDRARDLAPEARASFLSGVEDAELRNELEALLVAHDSSRESRFLEAGGGIVLTLRGRFQPGDRVGTFVILRQIGEGGQAVVYLAEKESEGVEKRFALKFLDSPGLDQNAFPEEGRILARLDHPDIATLFEARRTERGEPFLVLEFVDGQPIDEFCDSRELTLSQTLDLFREVCDAVQFAHEFGIIHRDLKPSNILVGPGRRPKLLDFGIASLVSSEPRYLAAATPGYASPEQLRGETPSTASDVYSLGAILERLVVPELADGAARTRRSVPRDLYAVIDKATAPERERRYPTVSRLLADLDRFEENRPVEAVGGGVFYRWRKQARRRWPLYASLAASLAVGLWVTSASVRRAAAEEAARVRAEQVSDFLTELFESADPHETHGDSLSLLEAVDRGVRLLSARPLPEELAVDLRETLGVIYRSLGQYETSRGLLEEACEALREGGPTRRGSECDLELAELYRRLETLELAEARAREAYEFSRQESADSSFRAAAASTLAVILDDLARYEEAESLLDEALENLETIGDEILLADGFTSRGRFYLGQSRLTEAVTDLEAALEVRRRRFGVRDPNYAQALNNLAEACRVSGDPGRALTLLGEALRVREEVFGPKHPSLVGTLANLGIAHYSAGDLESARRHLARAHALGREVLGPEHTTTLAAANNLAGVLSTLGRHAQAETMFREVLVGREAVLGREHPATAQALHNLGTVSQRRGDLEGAEDLYRRALTVRREALGERTLPTASTQDSLGLVLSRSGRLAEARRLLEKALRTRKELLPRGHVDIARTLLNLARVASAEGYETEARSLASSASEALREGLGDDHDLTIEAASLAESQEGPEILR